MKRIVILLIMMISTSLSFAIEKDDYIFEKSNSEKLSFEQLYSLSLEELSLARNEIFARHGYVFKTQKYRDYFQSKTWYSKNYHFNYSSLKEVERYNIKLIKYYENIYKKNYRILKLPEHTYKESNLKVYEDLNMDGKNEEIEYLLNDNLQGTLVINNQIIELDGMSLWDEFAIIDIKKDDSLKEIIISDDGPSSDYLSYIYQYDGEKIKLLGTVEGLYHYGMDLLGENVLRSQTRSSILQTWYFDKLYLIDDAGKLIEKKQEIYPTDYDLFLKEDMNLFSEKSSVSKVINIKEGSVVKIIATDDEKWCKVKQGDQIGWFYIEEYDKINGTDRSALYYFHGLCYAD